MKQHRMTLLQVSHTFRVMTYDVDFSGMVNNQVFVRWLEDLRNLLAEQMLSIDKLIESGVNIVLTKTEVDYLAPVRLADQVHGKMQLDDLGHTRFVLSAEFVSQQTQGVVARARQVGVFVSAQTGRPVAHPLNDLR